jgi:hypothetical protein
MMAASRDGDLPLTVGALLDACDDATHIDYQNKDGCTALWWACFRGYDRRVNLADDADIGFVFDLGWLSVESLILGAGKCLWLLCLGEK